MLFLKGCWNCDKLFYHNFISIRTSVLLYVSVIITSLGLDKEMLYPISISQVAYLGFSKSHFLSKMFMFYLLCLFIQEEMRFYLLLRRELK